MLSISFKYTTLYLVTQYSIFCFIHTILLYYCYYSMYPCPHVTQTCWTLCMVVESRVEGSYSPVAIVYETSARQSAAISDLQNHFFRAAFVVFGLHSVLKTLKPIQLRDSWRNCCLITIFVSCSNHLEYNGRDVIFWSLILVDVQVWLVSSWVFGGQSPLSR